MDKNSSWTNTFGSKIHNRESGYYSFVLALFGLQLKVPLWNTAKNPQIEAKKEVERKKQYHVITLNYDLVLENIAEMLSTALNRPLKFNDSYAHKQYLHHKHPKLIVTSNLKTNNSQSESLAQHDV